MARIEFDTAGDSDIAGTELPESVRIGFCLGGNDRETACGFVHDGPDFFAFFQ